MLISMTEFVQKKFFFNHLFEVVVPFLFKKWILGEEPCFKDNSMPLLTHGSRKDGRVGVEVWGLEFCLAEPLGAYPTVFQSEVQMPLNSV